MGYYVTVIDPTPHSPAGQVVDKQIVADFTDEKAIRELAAQSDYLTFEIELSNATILDEISRMGVEVNPSAKTLTLIKDKLLQKQFLQKAKIPTAECRAIEMLADLELAAKEYGFPFLLKARFDAYDGRGNALIRSKADIRRGLEKLKGRLLYVEKYVPFIKELAVMVARSTTGEVKVYPVVETIHKNNICHTVLVPAPIPSIIQNKAQQLAEETMKSLHGAGVFGLEMFLTKKGDVLINEIAPRVHNSGHYTVEACVTNQFEQHIRAITGLPLGETDLVSSVAVMVNILGKKLSTARISGLEKALKFPNTAVHIYGKAETKPERKMGHITVTGSSMKVVHHHAMKARKFISI
jgi:5-(carboxyamino)imidazole ribonucleotide synthase